jgi:hypothetical protein
MKRILKTSLLFWLLALPVLAVDWEDPMGKGATIQSAIGGIIKTAVGYVGVLGLLGFLYGGFQWMMAGGEAEKVKNAKNTMVWTVVGTAIVLVSYALVNFVISTLTGAAGIK